MSKEREESHFWKLSKKIIESPFLEIPILAWLYILLVKIGLHAYSWINPCGFEMFCTNLC